MSVYRLPPSVIEAIEGVRLPVLPEALFALLQSMEKKDVSMRELSVLVGRDPILAARVLVAANSPALGRGKSLKTIEDCLLALGTRVVHAIATCLAVQKMFDGQSGIASLDLSGFWHHSLLTAEFARSLATVSGYPNPEEAYLSGLLHDCGQLVLLTAYGAPYQDLCAIARTEAALCPLEKSWLGADHAEIGAWLIDRWALDRSIADGLLFHHAPSTAINTASHLPQLVWLAQACVAADRPVEEIALVANALSEVEGLDQLLQDAKLRVERIAKAMGVAAIDPAAPVPQSFPRAVFVADDPHRRGDAALNAFVGEMALLNSLQQKLSSLEALDELLLAVRESARILFGIDRLAFVFVDQQTGVVTGKGVAGQAPIFSEEEVLATAPSLVASAIRDGHPACSLQPAGTTLLSLLDTQFAHELGGDGIFCLPLICDEQPQGAMVIGVTAAQYTRLQQRLPALLNFARVVATSCHGWQAGRASQQTAAAAATEHYRQHARRVAHEAGNPLGIIKSYLLLLERRVPDQGSVQRELSVLREEIERVASIIRRMSEVPAPDAGQERAVDVNKMVRELFAVYGPALFDDKGMVLSITYADGEAPVQCDRDSLKQIFLNLAKNASEAMSAGGRFQVDVQDQVVRSDGQYVLVTLQDSGPGLPAAAVRRLQEPDAGDAPAGERGYGLSIVGALARQMGVEIMCRTRAGEGTSISLLLPAPDTVRLTE